MDDSTPQSLSPISPKLVSLDKPPSPTSSKVEAQQKEEKEAFSPHSPDYNPFSPPASPISPKRDTEAVSTAIIRYYKLKGDYNKKYQNAKKKITKSGLSLNQMKKKLKTMQMKCINCKQNGGTIFGNTNGVLTAKCGNTISPCPLDFQIKRGKWMLLPKSAQLSRDDIAQTKAEIIDLKLDLLFGLRTEEQIAVEFDKEKTQYKSLVKQLDMIEGVIQSEDKINVGDVADGEEPRHIPIKQYITIKNTQLNQLISTFKGIIKDYMEEDDITSQQDLMEQAINIYIEQIFPLMTKIRESKYAVTMMDTTEERGMFIMKQVKTLLQNLDFEYEFGEIISDKK
jgi:hypothetical protein